MTTKGKDLQAIEMLIQTGDLVGVTPGHALIERFCSAVTSGDFPDPNDLKTLAMALQPLRYVEMALGGDNARRDALEKFSKELGLTRKPGRQPDPFELWEEKARPTILFKVYLSDFLAQGEKPKQAEIHARNRAAEQVGIGDRQMRNLIKEHTDFADLYIELMIHAVGMDDLKKILEIKPGK